MLVFKIHKLLILLFYISILLTSTTVKSQSDEVANAQLIQAEQNTQNPAPLGSTVYFKSGIELIAGAETDKVALKLVPQNSSRFSIKVSTPLEDKKKSASLLSSGTNTLADSTSIQLTYRFLTLNDKAAFFNAVESNQTVLRKLNSDCADNPNNFGITDSKDCDDLEPDEKLEKYQKKMGMPYSGQGVISDIYNQLTFQTWGVSAEIGHKEFEYFDNTTLTEVNDDGVTIIKTLEDDKTPWSVGLYYQYLKPNDYSFWVELAYQEGYEAGKDRIKCLSPSDGAELIEGCIESQSEAPTYDENHNLSIGYRSTIPILERPFSFSTTYDFKDDEVSVAFPIYVFSDAKKNWTAGFRYDYESGDVGSTVSIFVGGTFNYPFK